jgi:hypothetical protein
MPLFEATWPDTASILISAYTTGEALHYISQCFGSEALYQLDELLEVKTANYLLARRCGHIYPDLSALPVALCSEASIRVFIADYKPSERHLHNNERAVIVVDNIDELPSLLLWHFDLLAEDDAFDDDMVIECWSENASEFQLLELDTEQRGVLLSYDYCNCQPTVYSSQATHPRAKMDLD